MTLPSGEGKFARLGAIWAVVGAVVAIIGVVLATLVATPLWPFSSAPSKTTTSSSTFPNVASGSLQKPNHNNFSSAVSNASPYRQFLRCLASRRTDTELWTGG